jgi:hypothetical protein
MAITVKQCKVCNSVFRNRIEELSIQGLNPERIYQYLQSLQDPNEQQIVKQEDIKPSSIRRHIDNHFKRDEAVKIKNADLSDRIQENRSKLQNGVSIIIDKVNSLCFMIDNALVMMEQIENDDSLNSKSKYSNTIAFMNTTKGLIESLAKLTGELKQEGTIDINFFSNEISTFADIVLESIREVDKKLELNGQMEEEFAQEFQRKWNDFKQLQTAVINGDAKPAPKNLTNNFNDGF